jgi:hypothetical protein
VIPYSHVLDEMWTCIRRLLKVTSKGTFVITPTAVPTGKISKTHGILERLNGSAGLGSLIRTVRYRFEQNLMAHITAKVSCIRS